MSVPCILSPAHGFAPTANSHTLCPALAWPAPPLHAGHAARPPHSQFHLCDRLLSSHMPFALPCSSLQSSVLLAQPSLLTHAPSALPCSCMQAFPATADLKPGAQATFRVAFRPSRDAAHYAQVRVFFISVRATLRTSTGQQGNRCKAIIRVLDKRGV